MTNNTLDEASLDTLFRTARSHSYWLDREVSDEHLRQIYELMKFGPTTANSCPARLVFVKSMVAKERLKPCLSEGNVRKSMEAPVVAIIGMDMEFYEKLPVLFPHQDARSWYADMPEKNPGQCVSLQQFAGRVFHARCARLGFGLRPNGRFRRTENQRYVFPRRQSESEFHLRHWLR